jgi:hypothetical protein
MSLFNHHLFCEDVIFAMIVTRSKDETPKEYVLLILHIILHLQ